MAKPTPELLACAERVLMYLGRSPELGLRYERSDTRLYGMSERLGLGCEAFNDWLPVCVESGHRLLVFEAPTLRRVVLL